MRGTHIYWRHLVRHATLRTFGVIRNRNTAVLMGIALITCVLVYRTTSSWLCKDSLPSWVRESDYHPFEPEVDTDFPTVAADKPRIPHIIHQTYKSELIPADYVDYMKTFSDLNPAWEYYFWTDELVRKLIEDKHPYLLRVWDTYIFSINRADALRFVILYEFGGVYADLDYECLRPLDRVTFKYTCIIPPEPFEQSALLYSVPFLLTNALMMCRPKHPFIKLMMDNLYIYHPMVDKFDITGPSYVTHHFLLYNEFNGSDYYRVQHTKESNAPYFYSGSLLKEHVDAVYVPNSQYFTNSLAEHGFRRLKQCFICKEFAKKSIYMQRACVDLIRRKRRRNSKYAFTDHHWMQSYDQMSRLWMWKRLIWGEVNIRQIVPRVKTYL